MTETPDPRPLHRRALVWAQSLMTDVDGLDRPTPCAEYDVRALLGHLVATVDRLRVLGEGGSASDLPVVISEVPDDGWADAMATAVQKMQAVWAEDALLDRPVAAPWGSSPGRVAVWGYTNETLVHGWDLAVATGQDPEADPELAEALLAAIDRIIPGEPRGGRVPFAPPVAPAPGTGPTERLANWSGHQRSTP